MSSSTCTRRLRRRFALGTALAAFLAISSSATRAQDTAGAVVTATNDATANAVLLFGRGPSGTISFVDAYSTGGLGSGGGLGNQGGLTLDRSGRLLLAVNAGSDSVSILEVGHRGLDLLDMEDSGGMRPISVTVHEDLVYVLNAGGDGNISGLRLEDDGGLSPLAGSTRPLSGSGTGPAEIAFSPDGGFLVVTEKATDTIVTYRVGDDGLPGDPVTSPSAGATPFGFSFDHRSRLMVSEAAGGAAGQSTVSSYDILPDGTLDPITAALSTGQSAVCWLVTTVNGRYAYVTNTGSGSITGFAVGRTGSLGLLDATGFSAGTGAGPIDAAVSRNGRFLYVLNSGDASISAYAIGADGGLTPLAGAAGLPMSANGLAAL